MIAHTCNQHPGGKAEEFRPAGIQSEMLIRRIKTKKNH